MKTSNAVGAGKNDPVERAGKRARLVERPVVVGRQDPDHRRLDRLGAHRFEALDELVRLIAGPRHQNALAEQRSRVEPSQVLAQRSDAPDDEDRRAPVVRLTRQAKQFVDRSDMRFLGRQRAVVDNRSGIVRRAGRAKEASSGSSAA